VGPDKADNTVISRIAVNHATFCLSYLEWAAISKYNNDSGHRGALIPALGKWGGTPFLGVPH